MERIIEKSIKDGCIRERYEELFNDFYGYNHEELIADLKEAVEIVVRTKLIDIRYMRLCSEDYHSAMCGINLMKKICEYLNSHSNFQDRGLGKYVTAYSGLSGSLFDIGDEVINELNCILSLVYSGKES